MLWCAFMLTLKFCVGCWIMWHQLEYNLRRFASYKSPLSAANSSTCKCFRSDGQPYFLLVPSINKYFFSGKHMYSYLMYGSACFCYYQILLDRLSVLENCWRSLWGTLCLTSHFCWNFCGSSTNIWCLVFWGLAWLSKKHRHVVRDH